MQVAFLRTSLGICEITDVLNLQHLFYIKSFGLLLKSVCEGCEMFMKHTVLLLLACVKTGNESSLEITYMAFLVIA